jgi:uncharacterized linocin/CFP29 family protein
LLACSGGDGASTKAAPTSSTTADAIALFCAGAKAFNDRFGGNVAQTAANFSAETQALDDLTKLAPTAIASDLQVVAKAAHDLAKVGDQLEAAFSNSDINVVRSVDSSLAATDPGFGQAAKNVKNFEDVNCPGSSTSTTVTATSSS